MSEQPCLVDKQVQRVMERESGLKRGMKGHHIFMISLGGVIGTGLFMSSGFTLGLAGPGGAALAYLGGGVCMFLVMLCLGELAVAMPVAGSFLTYAREFLHPSAGFTLGWLYWLCAVVTIAADLVVAGILLTGLFPSTSVLFWILFWFFALLALNCVSVNIFGEAEFWFCSFKVIAILCLIVVGTCMMMGLLGPEKEVIGFSNYLGDGGPFPNGMKAVFATMVVVSFSFAGTEIIGVTAGESDNPSKTIPRAVKNTAYRTLICYVASIIVIAAIVPWQEAGVHESIFAVVFRLSGIPYAETIMTFVVVTSALSSGNAWLYCAARNLWSMSRDGAAPQFVGRLNKNKMPQAGMVFTLCCSLIALVTEKMAPESVYIVFVSVVGLAGLTAWISICICQYKFRRQIIAAGKEHTLSYKVPLFPTLTIAALIMNLLIVFGSWFDEETRVGLIAFVPTIIFLQICYYLFVAKKHKEDDKALLGG